MDGASYNRIQLRSSQNQRVEFEQGTRLLLFGAFVSKRDAATASDVASPSAAGGCFAENDDDGAEMQDQELRGTVQKQRASLHVLGRQDEVLGRCQERDERVGGLSRRKWESSSKEEPQERWWRVQASQTVYGESSGL